MSREIALFGGSFNPPHVAHQMVCLLVLETLAVDEVWMMPTYRHAFAKDLEPFEDRCRMCELAAAAFGGRVVVSRVEEELGQERAREVSRTLDTIQALAARRPDARFRLVIGADILAETGKWYRWPDVAALARPIVIGRAGYDADRTASGADGWTWLDIELPRVSSTEVRDRIRRGHGVQPLVPRVVLDYIAERGLYR